MLIRASVRRAQVALGDSTPLSEYLVDLMHWASDRGVSFDAAAIQAHEMFAEERRGLF